jgi:hypothetical protein
MRGRLSVRRRRPLTEGAFSCPVPFLLSVPLDSGRTAEGTTVMTMEEALAISEPCDSDNGVTPVSAEARLRTDMFGVYTFQRRWVEVTWGRMQERWAREERLARQRVYGRAA